MYSDFAVQVTWEGANQVLALQAGRALLGSFNGQLALFHPPCPSSSLISSLSLADGLKGKKLAPGVAFLARPGVLTAKSSGKLDLEDIDQVSRVSSFLFTTSTFLTDFAIFILLPGLGLRRYQPHQEGRCRLRQEGEVWNEQGGRDGGCFARSIRCC